MSGVSAQEHTLRIFTSMQVCQRAWNGRFLVSAGLGEAGRSLARAAVACGACGLFLDWDPGHLRAAAQEACADFTVQTPTEALRVCKVELRRVRPLAVALVSRSQDEFQAHWQELVDRGVLPQFVAVDGAACVPPGFAAPMLAGGARPMVGLGLDEISSAPGATLHLPVLLQNFETEFCVRVNVDAAANFADRRRRDAELLATARARASGLGEVSANWLACVPVLFPRSLDRAVWMSGTVPEPAV